MTIDNLWYIINGHYFDDKKKQLGKERHYRGEDTYIALGGLGSIPQTSKLVWLIHLSVAHLLIKTPITIFWYSQAVPFLACIYYLKHKTQLHCVGRRHPLLQCEEKRKVLDMIVPMLMTSSWFSFTKLIACFKMSKQRI